MLQVNRRTFLTTLATAPIPAEQVVTIHKTRAVGSTVHAVVDSPGGEYVDLLGFYKSVLREGLITRDRAEHLLTGERLK